MKALASVKLRNQLLRINPGLRVSLSNVRVNGVLMGCSGFVTDPGTGRIVYVCTDHNHGTCYDRAYYRTASSTRDYTGGRNHFSSYDELAANVTRLLLG